MSDNKSAVRFPGKPEDASGDDLAVPARQLQIDLGLLGDAAALKSADGPWASIIGPPQSVAIIQSGATALAKWWSAALAGSATLTAAVAGFQGIWGSEHDPVRIAILGGAAIVLAGIAVALGVIVASDVRGRAAGQVSMVQARAAVANTFLALSRQKSTSTPAASSTEATSALKEGLFAALARGGEVQIQLSGEPKLHPVTGLRFDPHEKLQIYVEDDWRSVDEITAFSTPHVIVLADGG